MGAGARVSKVVAPIGVPDPALEKGGTEDVTRARVSESNKVIGWMGFPQLTQATRERANPRHTTQYEYGATSKYSPHVSQRAAVQRTKAVHVLQYENGPEVSAEGSLTENGPRGRSTATAVSAWGVTFAVSALGVASPPSRDNEDASSAMEPLEMDPMRSAKGLPQSHSSPKVPISPQVRQRP